MCEPEHHGNTEDEARNILKEKFRLEQRLGEIEVLERRAKEGDTLQRLQIQKVARKSDIQAALATIQAKTAKWGARGEVSQPPPGLSVAQLDTALAASTLAELKPHFRSERGSSSSISKGSEVVEVGLPFYADDHNVLSLTELPQLEQLLQAAARTLGDGNWLNEKGQNCRLNVICRHYLPGQSLGLHVDEPSSFEEDVYGCVLENTSEAALQFTKPTDSSSAAAAAFFLPECPGLCFRQRGEARYSWLHGLDPLTKGERFSVTWRWFQEGI